MPSPAPSRLDRRVPRLLRAYAEHRDPAALDELVVHFEPLVRRLALRYAHRNEPVDDLLQVANLGLLKALHGFDPGRGFAFSTYAVPTILGELRRYARESAWVAHVPRTRQERVSRLRAAHRALEPPLGRAPTVLELAAALGAEPDEVRETIRTMLALGTVSLDAPGETAVEPPLVELLGAPDPGYERSEDIATIVAALPVLSDRQREILHLRYAHDLKQAEIAARVGLSQMQISRILSAAVERLSAAVGHQGEAPVAA